MSHVSGGWLLANLELSHEVRSPAAACPPRTCCAWRGWQTQAVTFTLGSANLSFCNNQGQFAVEPGSVDVRVGDSSADGLHAQSP